MVIQVARFLSVQKHTGLFKPNKSEVGSRWGIKKIRDTMEKKDL